MRRALPEHNTFVLGVVYTSTPWTSEAHLTFSQGSSVFVAFGRGHDQVLTLPAWLKVALNKDDEVVARARGPPRWSVGPACCLDCSRRAYCCSSGCPFCLVRWANGGSSRLLPAGWLPFRFGGGRAGVGELLALLV